MDEVDRGDNQSEQIRAKLVQAVIEEVLRRRRAGDPAATDEAVLAANRDLLPELAAALSKLRLIRQAGQAVAALVRRKGPFAQPTSLGKEAFMRLVRRNTPFELNCRRCSFAAAVDQMAKIINVRIRRRPEPEESVPLNDFDAGRDLILDRFRESKPYDLEAFQRVLARFCHSRIPAKRRRDRIVRNWILGGLSLDDAAELEEHVLTQARRDEHLVLADLHSELVENKT